MKLLVALMAAFALACLAPATVFAEANPNNNGHHYHYGWYKHKTPPPPPAPVPVPTPSGGGTDGTHGVPGGVANNLTAPPPVAAPQAPLEAPPVSLIQQPSGTIITAATPLPSPQNVWLVAILTAFAAAAAITSTVWATGRSGHYALTRALAVVAITR